MPKVDVIMVGCPVTTDRGLLGIPTIVLIQGKYKTLYDVGTYATRHQLLSGLQLHGLTPSDIDRVILSHLHWDHALYMEPFRNAEVIISSNEYTHAGDDRVRDSGTPPFMVPALSSYKLTLVAGDEELEPGVQLIETPGHTAGFLAVKVTDGPESHIIAGDGIPHARFLVSGVHERGWFNQEMADRGMRTLASMKGVIYPAHDRPFRYDNKTGVVTYLQDYTITITCRFQSSGEATTLKVSC